MSKTALAEHILDRVEALLGQQEGR
jgi:hypothetical protein